MREARAKCKMLAESTNRESTHGSLVTVDTGVVEEFRLFRSHQKARLVLSA